MYGLNTAALEDNRIPAEGPFDTAVSNGLAAVLAYESPGAEQDNNGRVLPPNALLNQVREWTNSGDQWTLSIDVQLLKEGVDRSQLFRHGRADDEWTRVSQNHVAALVALDDHPALRILDSVRGKTLDEAVVIAYIDEVDEHLPFDPKDRSMVPEVGECPECWRQTLIAEGWDAWGVELGEEVCIACGYERTYEDTVADALQRVAESPD